MADSRCRERQKKKKTVTKLRCRILWLIVALLSECNVNGTAKKSWPELVGAKGFAAASIIEEEDPHVQAILLEDGSPVTMDFRCDRVWVWVNQSRIVIRTPVVG
ncbi:glu S.griseus protease inhibitor-like [Coffea eugenioides]|uniref:glu S.griseus protease inhibitor-like n=1 Tax=Coffea eugenioides TaxID=49369 RepID=UPI000F6082AD|nr:glu S.griseus protease inhibitor-like [Coffea eugenioides]